MDVVLNDTWKNSILLVENYYSCGSGGRVVGWSGRVVGWLDNLEIMLNSVQLSWNLTELGNI